MITLDALMKKLEGFSKTMTIIEDALKVEDEEVTIMLHDGSGLVMHQEDYTDMLERLLQQTNLRYSNYAEAKAVAEQAAQKSLRTADWGKCGKRGRNAARNDI